MNPWRMSYALAMFYANVPVSDQLALILPGEDRHPSYVEEWVTRYRAGLSKFFCSMDYQRQQKYAEAAWEKYGAEAARQEVRAAK